MPVMQRRRLHIFLFGVKVEAQMTAGGTKLVTFHRLTERDTGSTLFTPTGGAQISVAQYYAQLFKKYTPSSQG